MRPDVYLAIAVCGVEPASSSRAGRNDGVACRLRSGVAAWSRSCSPIADQCHQRSVIMRLVRERLSRWMALTVVTLLPACSHAGSELDLTRYDRTQDQQKIAPLQSGRRRGSVSWREIWIIAHRPMNSSSVRSLIGSWVRACWRGPTDVTRIDELTAEQHLSLTHGR